LAKYGIALLCWKCHWTPIAQCRHWLCDKSGCLGIRWRQIVSELRVRLQWRTRIWCRNLCWWAKLPVSCVYDVCLCFVQRL